MFRTFLLLIFSLTIVLMYRNAAAQGRIDCNSMNSHVLGQPVHYCVLLPQNYDSSAHSARVMPVLYFLHGLNENEQTLFKTGGWELIDDVRQKHKIGDFLIVTPEAKASFYINSA